LRPPTGAASRRNFPENGAKSGAESISQGASPENATHTQYTHNMRIYTPRGERLMEEKVVSV